MEQTAAATSRNHQLDGLRGFAAMTVIMFHAVLGMDGTQAARLAPETLASPYDRLGKIAIAIFNGEGAVVIFFVISGAVLVQSLRRETGATPLVTLHFTVRRLLRIYPALIVCLLFALLMQTVFIAPVGLRALLVNLTLADFPLIGASWTLQVELLAVPLLLAGWLVYRRWREAGLLALTIVVLTALRHTPLGRIAPQFSWFAICFAFGMFIPTAGGERIARLTPRHGWPVLLLVVMFVKHVGLFGGYTTTGTIQDVAAALLVNAVFHGRAAGLDSVLSTRFAAFYGRISYTLYLVGAAIFDATRDLLAALPTVAAHPVEFGLVMGPIYILAATPLAYAITLAAEKPAIRLGRRLTRPRIAVPAGTVAYPPPS